MPNIRIGAAASFILMPWQHLFRTSNNKTTEADDTSSQSDTIAKPKAVGYPTFAKNQVDGPRGISSRSEQVHRLIHSSSIQNPYDVLVIGGGATGAGIALDATTRYLNIKDPTQNTSSSSLRVACIERGDFASETSSRSTKLIWAGIRYLATATSSFLSRQLVTQPIQTFDNFYSEIQMVLHCHRERHYMTTKQQHLTTWVPILMPFTSWYISPPPFQHPLFSFFPILAPLVLKIYDGLSGFTCPSSYVLSPTKALQVFPLLRTSFHNDTGDEEGALKYCAVFYEAKHNDARTNLAIAMTAAQYGAHIANYVEMIGVIREEEVEDKTSVRESSSSEDLSTATISSMTTRKSRKVIGIIALDRMTQKEFPIYAKNIVFAGGPFTDQLRHMEYNNSSTTMTEKMTTVKHTDSTHHSKDMKQAIKSAAGTHIVLPGYYCPRDMGLLDYNTSDGRFLFILPWENHTLIGTTDIKIPAKSSPKPQEEEIEWILKECGKYLSKDLAIRRSDVLSGWTGYRPLVVDPHLPPGAPVSRDHVISVNPDSGIIFIAGGKWTTWRQMAQDVVDTVVGDNGPTCKTLDITLYGGDGWSPNLAITLLQKHDGMLKDVADNLAKTYGGRSFEVCELISSITDNRTGKMILNSSTADQTNSLLVQNFPYIDAEVRFACREYACTIEDILSRRTRLAFLNRDAALSAIPKVAEIMADELGWSETVKKEQVVAAHEYISSYAGRTID